MNCLSRHCGIVVLLCLLIVWANIQWIRMPAPTAVASGPAPAGSASCVSCHREICSSHQATAHYLSSSPAAAGLIKGSFRSGRNRIVYNEHMEVRLEKKGDRFFQTAYFNGTLYESESFDVVIGSGRKGQSFLYWDSVRLFQLPVSYYKPADSWCNSPGYPTNIVYFNKQVTGECMECHATSARLLPLENGFDKNSIVYGIDCERCHGPGDAHVAWHTAHPGEKEGREIISTRHLGRQQRLDACALCHSGFRKEVQPAFSFRVGDDLEKFSTSDYIVDSAGTLDVHGNQYGLLTTSKCFRGAAEMDCSSCHNVHRDEFGQEALFSQRCMSCHAPAGSAGQGALRHGCSFAALKELKLENNCIDCHMPALPSQKILLQLTGSSRPVHDLVRTHHIGIYLDISRQVAAKAGH
jgi:hypothetical protein